MPNQTGADEHLDRQQELEASDACLLTSSTSCKVQAPPAQQKGVQQITKMKKRARKKYAAMTSEASMQQGDAELELNADLGDTQPQQTKVPSQLSQQGTSKLSDDPGHSTQCVEKKRILNGALALTALVIAVPLIPFTFAPASNWSSENMEHNAGSPTSLGTFQKMLLPNTPPPAHPRPQNSSKDAPLSAGRPPSHPASEAGLQAQQEEQNLRTKVPPLPRAHTQVSPSPLPPVPEPPLPHPPRPSAPPLPMLSAPLPPPRIPLPQRSKPDSIHPSLPADAPLRPLPSGAARPFATQLPAPRPPRTPPQAPPSKVASLPPEHPPPAPPAAQSRPPPFPLPAPPAAQSRPPPFPLPAPPPLLPSACSAFLSMVDVRALDPPQWCHDGDRVSSQASCNAAYATIYSGNAQFAASRCTYNLASQHCSLEFGSHFCPFPPPAPPSPPSPPRPPPSPSSPPPPPSGPSAASIVDAINFRFANGHPSNSFSEAGVLVHQWDAFDTGYENGVPWRPCPHGSWCEKFSDRISGSLMNRRLPFMFDGRQSGFVVRPAVAQQALLCAYARDGGTMTKRCKPKGVSAVCIPGCKNVNEERHRKGVHYPDSLVEMLSEHVRSIDSGERRGDVSCLQPNCFYNEVVLDASVWARSLPDTIEAIFYPEGVHSAEAYAREVHKAFLKRFRAANVPLVVVDLKSRSSPFEVAPG